MADSRATGPGRHSAWHGFNAAPIHRPRSAAPGRWRWRWSVAYAANGPRRRCARSATATATAATATAAVVVAAAAGRAGERPMDARTPIHRLARAARCSAGASLASPAAYTSPDRRRAMAASATSASAPRAAPLRPGTRASPYTGCPVVSTGVRALDGARPGAFGWRAAGPRGGSRRGRREGRGQG